MSLIGKLCSFFRYCLLVLAWLLLTWTVDLSSCTSMRVPGSRWWSLYYVVTKSSRPFDLSRMIWTISDSFRRTTTVETSQRKEKKTFSLRPTMLMTIVKSKIFNNSGKWRSFFINTLIWFLVDSTDNSPQWWSATTHRNVSKKNFSVIDAVNMSDSVLFVRQLTMIIE